MVHFLPPCSRIRRAVVSVLFADLREDAENWLVTVREGQHKKREGKGTHSWSLNREYSSSPTLTGDPPYYKPRQPQPPIPIIPCIPFHSNSTPFQLPSPQKRVTTYLRNQHLIPSPNAHLHPLPLLIQRPRPDSQHARLVQLLDAALGEEDARRRLRLRLDALHQHAVEERRQRLDRFERCCL